MICFEAIKVTAVEIQSDLSLFFLNMTFITVCDIADLFWQELLAVGLCFLFLFCFNLNSVILFMCPNVVAFEGAESHSWFILMDGSVNSPSSFFILRAAKPRFTHPVSVQYILKCVKVGLDIFLVIIPFLGFKPRVSVYSDNFESWFSCLLSFVPAIIFCLCPIIGKNVRLGRPKVTALSTSWQMPFSLKRSNEEYEYRLLIWLHWH